MSSQLQNQTASGAALEELECVLSSKKTWTINFYHINKTSGKSPTYKGARSILFRKMAPKYCQVMYIRGLISQSHIMNFKQSHVLCTGTTKTE